MAFDIRDDEGEHHPDEFEEYDDVKQTAPPKFYRRRKFWMFCIPNLIIATIVAVLLGLYVIMPKIAQSLMNKATIEFNQIVSKRYSISEFEKVENSLLLTNTFCSFVHSRTSQTPQPQTWTLPWSAK